MARNLILKRYSKILDLGVSETSSSNSLEVAVAVFPLRREGILLVLDSTSGEGQERAKIYYMI